MPISPKAAVFFLLRGVSSHTDCHSCLSYRLQITFASSNWLQGSKAFIFQVDPYRLSVTWQDNNKAHINLDIYRKSYKAFIAINMKLESSTRQLYLPPLSAVSASNCLLQMLTGSSILRADDGNVGEQQLNAANGISDNILRPAFTGLACIPDPQLWPQIKNFKMT